MKEKLQWMRIVFLLVACTTLNPIFLGMLRMIFFPSQSEKSRNNYSPGCWIKLTETSNVKGTAIWKLLASSLQSFDIHTPRSLRQNWMPETWILSLRSLKAFNFPHKEKKKINIVYPHEFPKRSQFHVLRRRKNNNFQIFKIKIVLQIQIMKIKLLIITIGKW